MDKRTQKLKTLVEQYLHLSKADILKALGKPCEKSEEDVWFYCRYQYGIFRSKHTFIFEEDELVDISITEYFFFFIETNHIFYYENQNPACKVMQSF